MFSLGPTFRPTLRWIRRRPTAAVVAVVAFALGIGLTTAMISIVHGALRELPFEDADRLIHLERTNLSERINSMEVTHHDFEYWREEQTSFDGLAAFGTGTANLSDAAAPPERLEAAFITANGVELLGEKPLHGRFFRPEEQGPASPDVVVLGYDLWRNRYESDPSVVGREVRINSKPHTVIGVMGKGFLFPVNQNMWLPLKDDASQVERGKGDTLEVYGRLRDGVSLDQARLELASLAADLEREFPESNEGVGSLLKPYTEEYVGEEPRQLLTTLLAAVFLVFLIACGNVANLLLARAIDRGRELAIHSALGSSRGRIIRTLMAEVMLLAVLGSVLGLGLAHFAVQWFNGALVDTDPPFWIDIRLDPLTLAAAGGLTLLAAVLAGLVPAWRASRGDVHDVLQDESKGSQGLKVGGLSKALVIGEVTLSCALLVGAGLIIQSVRHLSDLDLGYDTDAVWTARIGLFEGDYPDDDSKRRFFADLEERVAALPAVSAAGVATTLPGAGGGGWSSFEVEGESYDRPQDRPRSPYSVVSAKYFDTTGLRPLKGRVIRATDREDSMPVVLVSASLAATLAPEGDPLGKRLRLDPDDPEEPWRTVVGVVPDQFMEGLGGAEYQDAVYVPAAQVPVAFMFLMARTSLADPTALTPEIRQVIAGLDPHLPLYWVRSHTEAIQKSGWFYWVFGNLFIAFGVIALLLAAVGLYGVMAFAVERRRQEVGIRMALGARGGQVLGMIFRQGVWQLLIGLVLGLGLALVLARSLSLVLFEVNPADPWIYLTIGAVLALTGGLACLIPARRAAQLDPALAMRQE